MWFINSYALIYLLFIKKLNHNLINYYVEKILFLVKIYAKKLLKLINQKISKNKILKKRNAFIILIQIQQIEYKQQHKYKEKT